MALSGFQIFFIILGVLGIISIGVFIYFQTSPSPSPSPPRDDNGKIDDPIVGPVPLPSPV